jgi:NADH:ubiquinone oxidoreductase subunit B-like Fe-S oxidoreductase
MIGFNKDDAMIEGVMKEGFITTSYDSVVNWAKTGSLWPMTFGWLAVRSR